MSAVAAGRIPSASCSVDDLADVFGVPEEARRELACGAGWESRWEVSWRSGGTRADAPVRELGLFTAEGCVPWRHFTWRTGAAATVLTTLAGLLWWTFRQGRNAGQEEARREAGL